MRSLTTFFAFFSCAVTAFGLYESKLGKIDASASLKLAYDSRVFGMPSDEFNAVRQSGGSAGINTDRIESEDDFIITFSPAVHFTNKLGLEDMGEFTGYAWTQSGEDIVTATLQGVVKKNGAVFDMYTFDAVSNGLINVATGEMDLVNRTMRFTVAPLK